MEVPLSKNPNEFYWCLNWPFIRSGHKFAYGAFFHWKIYRVRLKCSVLVLVEHWQDMKLVGTFSASSSPATSPIRCFPWSWLTISGTHDACSLLEQAAWRIRAYGEAAEPSGKLFELLLLLLFSGNQVCNWDLSLVALGEQLSFWKNQAWVLFRVLDLPVRGGVVFFFLSAPKNVKLSGIGIVSSWATVIPSSSLRKSSLVPVAVMLMSPLLPSPESVKRQCCRNAKRNVHFLFPSLLKASFFFLNIPGSYTYRALRNSLWTLSSYARQWGRVFWKGCAERKGHALIQI